MAATTVILGGGFGGVAAGLEIRQRLGPDHRVILIDRSPIAHLCGANPLLIVGERPEEGVTRSIESLTEVGIEVVRAEITGIDLDQRAVATDGDLYRFDYLVVALGASYDWDAVPGSGEAHTFYHHRGARRLRERLSGFDGGRIVFAVGAPPYKCPPAPMEAALIVDWWARRRGIRDQVDLHLFIPEPAPLAVAGPEAGGRVAALFEERGIALHTGATLTEVGSAGSVARFADGSSIDADIVAAVPVHRVPQVVASSGLTDGKPWVPVEPATLETAVPDVFAIGDVNAVPTGPDRGIPKAGVFAAGEGETVGGVIVSRILGSGPPAPYDGRGHCFLAFSGEESATVGGTFLAPGAPDVALSEASVEGMATKMRWETDWQAFRI